MKDRNFCVGDEVEYDELVEDAWPRWHHNRHRQGTYRTVRRKIISVHEKGMKTFHNDDVGCWVWPLPGHALYDEKQWDRPGYIRKVAAL